MALTLPNPFICLITISILLSFALCQISAEQDGDLADEFLVRRHSKSINTMRRKLTHFRFYWHDVLSGRHPSSARIINSSSPNGFGMVNMIDNRLTVGPNMTSKLVGKAQGFYAGASHEDVSLLMAMNLYFTTGKYKGSTLTILGRNSVFDKVREMPVIGGSGLFRFASGYVQARTEKFVLKTGDATVKYDVYVMHY